MNIAEHRFLIVAKAVKVISGIRYISVDPSHAYFLGKFTHLHLPKGLNVLPLDVGMLPRFLKHPDDNIHSLKTIPTIMKRSNDTQFYVVNSQLRLKFIPIFMKKLSIGFHTNLYEIKQINRTHV